MSRGFLPAKEAIDVFTMSTYQVRSLEEADQIIREHERKTKTTYALLRSTKNFGCVDVPGELS